ncbi:MAG: UDP-N-acetylmuramyl-tripeptide synthetase [Spirochaetes bacterium]|nr:UDP-N-acetylmuramyl-tripeptide synthetase [Spirochaetota bacterium]
MTNFSFKIKKNKNLLFNKFVCYLNKNIEKIKVIDKNFYFSAHNIKNQNIFINRDYIFHDTRKLYSSNNDNFIEKEEFFKKNKIKINKIFVFIKGNRFNPYDEFEKIFSLSDILILDFNEEILYKNKRYKSFIAFIKEYFSIDCNNISELLKSNESSKENKLIDINKIFINCNNTKLLYNFLVKFINYFIDEKKFIIGVTGTDGKTSTVNITRQLFNFYNKNSSSIGTLGVNECEKDINFIFSTPTSPEIWDLFEIISNLNQSKNIFMEVTSIGSELFRFHSIYFDGLVFTNMTSDHLDFHKTLENYYNAKLKIIDILSISNKKNKFVLANIDDRNFYLVRDYVKKYNSIKLYTYGYSKDADFNIEKISSLRGVTEYKIKFFNKFFITIKTSLIGKFNGYNIITSIALYFLKYRKIKNINNKFFNFYIKGRLEKINFKSNDIYVDYAHTSNSLYTSINVLKDENYNYILTVFGCGGDRDKSKRPEMGKIAYENSNLVIITSDNPRNENPSEIINEIIDGIDDIKSFKIKGNDILNEFDAELDNIFYKFDKEKVEFIIKRLKNNEKVVIIEEDRRKAIFICSYLLGFLEYSAGLIAGKGHEDYQEIKGIKYHFSDQEEVCKFIKLLE